MGTGRYKTKQKPVFLRVMTTYMSKSNVNCSLQGKIITITSVNIYGVLILIQALYIYYPI